MWPRPLFCTLHFFKCYGPISKICYEPVAVSKPFWISNFNTNFKSIRFYVFLHDSMSDLKEEKNRFIYLPIFAADSQSKTARNRRYVWFGAADTL